MPILFRILLFICVTQICACASYLQVLEDNKRMARDPDYIRMQQEMHEANMRMWFPNR